MPRRPLQKAPPASHGLRALATAPRLIGLLATIIAAITLAGTFTLSSLALALAGLALMLAPRSHAAKVLDAFTGSFQRWQVVITVAFSEALFWLVVIVAGKGLGDVITAVAQGVRGLDAGAQGLAAIAVVEANTGTITGVFAGIIGSLLAWLAITFLAYAGSRWMMWRAITGGRPPFRRWLAASALWWLIWLLPAVFFVIGLQASYLGFGLGLLFILLLHLGSPFHHALVTVSPRKAIAHAFSIGLGRIHRFIVPWAYALLVYIILYQPFRFLNLQGRGVVAGYIVLIALFLGWFRTYMREVIEKVINK